MVARGRPTELGLLLFPLALLGLGITLLGLVSRQAAGAAPALPSLRDAWPALLFAVAVLAVHLLLVWRWPSADQLLLPLAAMLAAIGLLMVGGLEPGLYGRQAVWIALGAVALAGVLTLLPSVDWLARYKYTWAAAGSLLVLTTFVLGVDLNESGMRLWIGAGGVYFQPSELYKVILVIFLAAYLAERRELIALTGWRVGPLRLPPVPYLLPMLVVWLLSLGLVVVQRDLGAALLFFGVFLALLYVATARLDYVAAGLGTFALGAAIAYQLFGHVRDRVAVWLDPFADAQGRGYQIVQALYALASGGVLGAGL